MITWRQQLGLKECPYMERWIINFHFFSIRLHHWKASDDLEFYHDHPWWFITLVLKGSYTNISEDHNESMTPGTIRFRSSLHKHKVQVAKNGAWTLLLTGKEKHKWGFYTHKGFMKSSKFFHRIGHHPCKPGNKRIKTSERNKY